MNQVSSFQLENPLNVKRKFWKKMIDKSILNFFLSLIIGFLVYVLIFGSSIGNYENDSTFNIFLSVVGSFLFSLVFLNIVYAIYVKAYIKRYYYDCGDQFITIKKGVFAPTEIHVQYPKIQDVYVDQDILDRIMGLYDVHIASATATSGIEAHIDGVNFEVAERIKNFILNKIQGGGIQTQTPQVQQQATPVNFSEKISSADYPIASSWIVSSIISVIISSFIYAAIIMSIFGEILADFSDNSGQIVVYGFLLFIFIFVCQIIYLFVWKSNYFFELTPEFILLKTGVISRQENHLPYKSIQNISTSQGIIERMFGLATVTVENAASVLVDPRRGTMVQSGISIVGQPLQKAEYINQVLNKIVVSIKNSGSTGL